MIYLYLAVLSATLFGYGVPILNIVAPYFFYQVAKRNFSISKNPFYLSLLLFTGWLIAVTLYYKNFLGLLAGIFAILPTVLLFFYTVEKLDRKKAFNFLKILVALSMITAPIAFYQHYIQKVSIFERAYATFGNANFYASYLLMVIPSAFGLMLHAKEQKKKLFWGAVSLINIYCLVLTNSRASIVALFIAFLIFALLAKNYRLLMVTAVITMLVGIAVFINPELIPRYSIISDELTERLTIWSLGWYAITQHPIIGTGLTSFYTQYVMNYPGKYAPHAHNLYLNILVEGGVIALILLLWNLTTLYRQAFTKLLDGRNVLVIGIIAGLSAALLQSFLDNPLENFQTGTIFAFFTAVLLKL